jgi:hypothetical protein
MYYRPGTVNFDIALYKEVPLSEHHKVQFRAEAFNILNHTNFSTVQTSRERTILAA